MAKKLMTIEKDHAKLSPSGASRWLVCHPSANLEAQFPDKSSEAADEGTFAHGLGELKIRVALGLVSLEAYEDCLVNLKKSKYWSEDMTYYTNEYRDFVVERFLRAKTISSDAIILLETKLDLRAYIPEGFGTGDVIIIYDGVLEIIDLKYGKGVEVQCEENKQMMIYGLGALEAYGFVYEIEKVIMTIYQPRLENISDYTLDSQALLNWGEGFLKPRALLAYNGEGEFVAGKHCGFCKAKPRCRKLAEENLRLAALDFADPNLLSDKELAEVLSQSDVFKNWLGAVETYCLSEALSGREIRGFKLVEGRSNRAYSDSSLVVKTLVEKGIDEALLYERKILGITAMEKTLSKKVFNEFVGDLIIKPQGKPALVPWDDKRPVFEGKASAESDFADLD